MQNKSEEQGEAEVDSEADQLHRATQGKNRRKSRSKVVHIQKPRQNSARRMGSAQESFSPGVMDTVSTLRTLKAL